MADTYGHRPRGPLGVLKAFRWSMLGIRAAWLHESSFRLEAVLTLLLAPLSFWLAETPVELVLLLGSLLMVLAAELLNSAIEAIIERYGSEHHELAGRAKDMGSAAVLMTLASSALAWGAIALM
ncbi:MULTISPECIES: diacylglycerol kinase [Stenotrophomonas]|jgi:diacylglycerol kinase (ATP)|uniref:diacylglycerol kinase n=1 Tax=Stenotrophomonas TaxID=40323 RepID=UPI00039000B7|nr:diacylglycerol kinase [Stenotrophomonas maltophilia]EQM88006.1 DeoR family transcriptional regulator [Stenotrophomonas maltophilia MF89]OHY71881.1 diacylglycerol kinase [Stenotrophomonas maltophilia]UUS13684.1 diacylglycerol kinase [Stenotrophomonas sp. CD2]